MKAVWIAEFGGPEAGTRVGRGETGPVGRYPSCSFSSNILSRSSMKLW